MAAQISARRRVTVLGQKGKKEKKICPCNRPWKPIGL
jgi:hypothetical protein